MKPKGKPEIGTALVQNVRFPLSKQSLKSIYLSNTKPQNSATRGT